MYSSLPSGETTNFTYTFTPNFSQISAFVANKTSDAFYLILLETNSDTYLLLASTLIGTILWNLEIPA